MISFKNLFTRKPKEETTPNYPHKVSGSVPVFAFTSNGRHYFEWPDDKHMPKERFNAMQDVLTELSFRTDRSYLEALYKAIVQAALDNKRDEVIFMAKEAEKRLNWITNVDLLYKLASVRYIDTTETPDIYDQAYAVKKMEHWKKEDMPAFFLKSRMQDLFPAWSFASEHIRAFSDQQQRADLTQYAHLLSVLSGSDNNKEIVSNIQSQMAALKSAAGFAPSA